MKQLLILFLLLCTATVVRAQDVIVKKDGSTVVCRVVELNATEIVYKKWSDLNGANYIMDRSLASAINYENGKKEQLGEVQNQYQPGNQNDGTQQLNDNALLRMDYATQNPYKKVKILKTIGWIGGIGLVGTGAGFIIGAGKSGSGIGSIFIAGGVAWGAAFLLSANKAQRNIESKLQSSVIYQEDFKMGNASLTAGVNLIKDNVNHNQTLGLGLRYNF